MELNEETFQQLELYGCKSSAAIGTALRFCNKSIVRVAPGLFDPFGSFQELYLANNSITTLPKHIFSKLTELRRIDLENNKITSLEGVLFENNSKLEMIELGGNGIESLPSEVFGNLPNLRRLFLDNNKLKSLDLEWLKSSTKLQKLYLHENNLTEIKGHERLSNLFPRMIECRLEGNKFTPAYLEHVIISCDYPGMHIVGLKRSAGITADSVYGIKIVPPSSLEWIINHHMALAEIVFKTFLAVVTLFSMITLRTGEAFPNRKAITQCDYKIEELRDMNRELRLANGIMSKETQVLREEVSNINTKLLAVIEQMKEEGKVKR